MEPENFLDGKVIDGKKLSKKIRSQIASEVERLTELHGIAPKLTTVIVGEDPGSKMYVRMKHRACKRAGILSDGHSLPADTSEEDLIALIEELNRDVSVHGILVQLPLPRHIDEETIISAIDPNKDVDGFSPRNIYRLFYGGEMLSSATPQGIVTMLDNLPVDLDGMHGVIINRSTIVGKPLIMLLLNRNITVTVCHSHTQNLESKTRQADILVTAVGRRQEKDDPYFITADMVKEGAIVIDVATPNGDVDFDAVKEIASYITPVPGGVGPMTITMLLKNVLAAYSFQQAQTNVLTTGAIDYGSYVS
ncbi:bifunctional 5,10-methylenetetrahydrofolate dehydrogenase/5,10-methenyltetrahydrofolate cyclohydrolase [Candidatus Thorarchaeota archaeon]|nr:MAG: bifunctional 5,10-methylenetetrahydrofolate dehydrogenase/5,10-methenyltetrahydrofolate cyclohydrolase [Candidatus Thorarchaeota archaeon]